MKFNSFVPVVAAFAVCASALSGYQKSDSVPFTVAEGLFDQADTNTLSLSYPKGLETYTVWQAKESGDHYCNGVALAQFKGKLYCQWQSSETDEDAPDTKVMYSISSDKGKTWSEAKVLCEGIENGYRSSGGWLATDDRLIAYINEWPDGVEPRGGNTLYIASTDGTNWTSPKPVTMADNTPMNAVFEQDPHVLSSGRIINAAHFRDGLYAYPIYTDDKYGISGWKKGDFTPTDSGSDTSVEMEPSSFVQKDGSIVMIFRDQKSRFVKIASESKDNGESWSTPVLTDMPDARTKQSAGNLSDGTAFMVGCPLNNKLRAPLAVTLSSDGESFDKAYLVRDTESMPEVVYEGKAKRKGYHYAKSLVCDGSLYIGYATDKEAVEVSVIPEDSLK